jgi:hypothetical protein
MPPPLFLLDKSETVPAPTGYTTVLTEIEFLLQASASIPLLVQGTSLCRWAQEFCFGRDYPWEEVRPPVEWLRLYCPALTKGGAKRVYDLIEQHSKEFPKSYRARDVLETLFKQGPWSEQPGREHAARWLLWLEEHPLDSALEPLLSQMAQSWVESAPEGLAALYAITDAAAAQEALATWLGINNAGLEREEWGSFPLAVPGRWRKQARTLWEKQSVTKRPTLLAKVQERQAPYDIRMVAAQMTAEYFQQHAKDLTAPVLASLEGLLPEAEAAQLRRLCPPEVPGPLPESISDVLEWFTGKYLPFRVWEQEHGDDAAHAVAYDLASQFESWCLRFYPTALAGGLGSEHLAISRARRLQQSRQDGVTLWVVFDGLTYYDGQALARMLAEEPRLSLGSLTPTLSLLPTITQFCKRPLIEGLPSGSVNTSLPSPSWLGARALERNREAGSTLAEAVMGDVFVWPLTQPDKTYHDKYDAPTIRRNVQSELERWAKAIRDAAKAVPAHLPLRVIFTTDHGRLLSAGSRTLDVPAGMEAHGRAAYGPSGQTFDASGVLRDEANRLVYLDKDRFRLEKDCAIALGTSVFKTNDGKTGQEWFPHGGLSPEEVLIPWCELTRDLTPPMLRALLSGQGRAGTTQAVQVQLENLGAIPVVALTVALTIGGETRVLALDAVEVGPLSSVDTTVEISRWPNSQQIESTRAAVEFVLPGGSRVTIEASITLQTQEMQRGRDANLLEDL